MIIKSWGRDHLPVQAIDLLRKIRSFSIQNKLRHLLRGLQHTVSEFLIEKRVSFIVVGAQKSGTTALWYFLKHHPELSMSLIKETDFFSYQFLNDDGNYQSYHRLFHPFPKDKLLGEASPSYMLDHMEVAKRIYDYNPHIKLIFILKNPIDRAYSQYKMHKVKFGLDLTFEECLNIARNPSKEYDIGHDRVTSETIRTYLPFGCYTTQIRSYLKKFKKSQMLFLRTEDLLLHHNETMNKICEFLMVKNIAVKPEIVRSFDHNIPMNPEAQQFLLNYYSAEIGELEEMLKWDLSHWREITAA